MQAETSCVAASCWFQDGPASYAGFGAYQSIAITYTSTLNSPSMGIVFAVIHNYMGQTTEISTATLSLGAGANGTAYPLVFGLPPAEYSATLFVTSVSGVAISSSTTLPLTVSD